LRLTEYEPAAEQLSRDELTYLLRFVGSGPEERERRLFESITPTPRADIYELRPGPFVGRLGLPSGRSVDFASRFSFDDVIELIRFSSQPPVHRDLLRAEAEADRGFVDVLAAAFTREVERLVGLGLGKGYRRRRFLRPPYPGQVDFEYHLGHLGARQDRLATGARRLTINMPVNQGLAAALEVLRRVPLANDLVPRLSRLASCLRAVERPPMSADDVARIPLTNLTFGYRDALGLAQVILRSLALAPRAEDVSGASILFYMPKVWENCVRRWVEDAFGPDFRVEGGYGFDLTAAGELRSYADVVVLDGDRLVAIYDAKYKWPKSGPSAADIYQMVTYCERLGLSEATLVYPAFREPEVFRVGSRTIRTVGLRFPGFDAQEAARMLRPVAA
jgi:5-methylcytosine-specific restriction endonuclease McrBC regulatory subunit McrC